MNDRLTGKVAVITGSTGGLGEGIARRLAAEGAAVVVSGRRVEIGERVVREIVKDGGEAAFVRADVTSADDCVNLIQATLDRFGRLDVLVNNAAHFGRLPFEDLTEEFWDHVFAVNVSGPLFCSRAAIPPMRRQGGGCIVNIGTTIVYRGAGAQHGTSELRLLQRSAVNDDQRRWPGGCSPTRSALTG